ncbi:hypothetical protein A2U01_0087536, partial [Trifolium medium]|nr:hypothetical protein [Trifolium medium]
MAGGTRNNQATTQTTNPPDKIDLLADQIAQMQATFSSAFAEFSSRVESLERRTPNPMASPSISRT